MLAFAEDFNAIANVDVARAFGPGSDKGTTRAKPGIWANNEDFVDKYQALQAAAGDLLSAAQSGDRKAIGGAIKNTGGTCKGCTTSTSRKTISIDLAGRPHPYPQQYPHQ